MKQHSQGFEILKDFAVVSSEEKASAIHTKIKGTVCTCSRTRDGDFLKAIPAL